MSEDKVSRVEATFAALNAYDVERIMQNWGEEIVYDNPMVGSAAHGRDEVRERLIDLVALLKQQGQQLVADRVTEGPDHAILEWHVEGDSQRNGVHAFEFDPDGLIRQVTVYPRTQGELAELGAPKLTWSVDAQGLLEQERGDRP